ncbi:hypothetical protein [Alteribacillus iranensis]|uniref:Uncharacterized protein n=1 Tax=Alteribacillus iranensis TaxID=930128 RepID=A0A1I2BW73_9BACI|nr:hypothetical protein [Alteribacillus iranensis]SFE60242.1 hypothetical protein SAMN05192532_102537 [Alteribacillus iranensis]
MVFNHGELRENRLEYFWGVRIITAEKDYELATINIKAPNSSTVTGSIEDYTQTDMWEEQENEYFSNIYEGHLAVNYGDSSLKITAPIPDGLQSSDIEKVRATTHYSNGESNYSYDLDMVKQ